MSARGVQLVCVAAVMVSGCGTLDNVTVRNGWPPPAVSEPANEIYSEPANRVYGGVTADAKEFWGLAKLGPVPISNPWAAVYVVQLFGSLIDIPLSAVGDTLTLPVTIPATIKRNHEGSGQSTHEGAAGDVAVRN